MIVEDVEQKVGQKIRLQFLNQLKSIQSGKRITVWFAQKKEADKAYSSALAYDEENPDKSFNIPAVQKEDDLFKLSVTRK